MTNAGLNNKSLASDHTYCRNMAALFRVDPCLAQRIDQCVDDGSVIVEASRQGPPTASVALPDAHRTTSAQSESDGRTATRRLYLHSRVDPQAEARRLADSVEIGEAFCYIVGGFGLGHLVKALHARLKGDAFIIVTEPNLQLLRAAMETVELADLFADDRCVILTSTDKNEIQTRLEPHNTVMMLGTQIVSHPPSERVNGAFQATMRKLIADHMTYCRMCLMTLVANARITCQNVANNLPRYVSTPPIDKLRERFAGYPAIVVAAGPSLRRNIDQLPHLKDRAVIIAVQTTFKMLLERGIRPHFVTSLDYHEMSKRFFEGIEDFSGTHLVAEPKVTWHVVDTYRGPVSLLNNDFARLLLGDRLAARGGLKAGATVAHLALYLAVYMGCDPIILIGQDLGYTDHVYYVPGVAIHDTWRPELNRFCTMEMKEWERIVRSRKILMKVKDIHGQDIYTDEQLFTYLQQFEGDFAAMPGRVIDATEGGVRKAGTRVMTLAEAARQYCTRPLPPERLDYLRELNWDDRSRLEPARAELEQRRKDVDAMIDVCERMIRILQELTGLLDRPAEFNRRIADVDALRLKVRQMSRTYEMISAVSQLAELQRFRADRQLSLENVDAVARARRQLERDIRFVKAVADGAGVLKDILAGSLARFDAAIAAARQEHADR